MNTSALIKLLAAASLLAGSQFVLAQTIPDYVRSAVASDARTEEMTARDPARKPAEILALSGVKPGDKVVEFAGFGQYYTTMLSEILGDNGELHVYDLPYTGARAGTASTAFTAEHANTNYHLINYNLIDLPQDVDVVFNVLYYHDLALNNIDADVLNRKIFNALKPGGVFFIIDHNAAPGSGTRDTERLHRIDPEVIKREVLAAGFTLAEDSKLLAHPEDKHDAMVFTPGARGATDRAVLKFVKPR
jgi:predicted methyltransferase